VSSSIRRLADALIRLCGANPAFFRPLYRTQKLLLQRRSRIVPQGQGKSQSGSASYRLLCLFASVYGLTSIVFFATSNNPVLSAVLAVTIGCFFLLLVVITDNFDVLVNPRELLVMAAHPHDDRSFLLAKIAAIGRSLTILAALLFVLPGIAAGFALRSPAATFAFLAGAAGAGLATALSGLLLAVLLLRMGGRQAMERFLPWIQGFFQIGYLLMAGGQTLLDLRKVGGTADLGLIPWLAPPFWFIAPLELLAEGPSTPVFGRLFLALATMSLLLGGATRWLGAGLSERLLEPVSADPVGPARRVAVPLRTGRSERARLFTLLRVHLRSDWRTRSEFLVTPLIGVLLLLFNFRDRDLTSQGLMPIFFYCWLLMLSGDVLTRTSRPESLWWILAAPIDRTRFSLATLSLVRFFQLAPLFGAAVLVRVWSGGASWQHQLAAAAELLALGDLIILVGKGLFPEFPFSRPRASGGVSSGRTALTLIGSLVSSLAVLLVFLFGRFGIPGILAGATTFALLRIPAALWVRRRTSAAAERLELAEAAA
jgi:hypothetical protein